MQARAYAHRGEQYLLIKSPPASGKSRALMFIALDKLTNQGVKQAIIVVPERSIGGSFADEPLSRYGFWADWTVKPHWNLCNVPGADDVKVAKSKVKAVGEFLASDDKVLVCTHATFRFAIDDLGLEAFDDRLIAVDEFHHVSANPDNRLGAQLGQLIARDKVYNWKMFARDQILGDLFARSLAGVLAAGDARQAFKEVFGLVEQVERQLIVGFLPADPADSSGEPLLPQQLAGGLAEKDASLKRSPNLYYSGFERDRVVPFSSTMWKLISNP